MTFGILQIYCGASGRFGAYNCQEIGLAKALTQKGHRCVVFYPETSPENRPAGQPARAEVSPGVVVRYLPARHLSVHAFYPLEPLLEEGVETALLLADNHLFAPSVHRFCKKHGILCGNYVGAIDSDSTNTLKKTLMDLAARRNLSWFQKTPTFAKTPLIAARLAKNGVCAEVAPVALDLSIIPEVSGTKEEIRQKLGLSQNATLLLYVGRLDAYKRPMDLCEILRLCAEKEDSARPVQLVLIGDGVLAGTLEQRMQELGLSARITRIPQLANDAVQAYYHAADAFINCNDHEIFGMSILEAMYAGCPVIARHAPGPDFIIRDGETGFLVSENVEYAAALSRLSPAVGKAAHREILEHFQWSNTAEILLTRLAGKGKMKRGNLDG